MVRTYQNKGVLRDRPVFSYIPVLNQGDHLIPVLVCGPGTKVLSSVFWYCSNATVNENICTLKSQR